MPLLASLPHPEPPAPDPASSVDEWTPVRRALLERRLRRELEGEVHFDDAFQVLYATDASHYRIRPMGVVIPRSVADLQAVMAAAAEHRVPLVARGGGTSLSGQTVGPGLVLDTSKFVNRLVDLSTDGRWVRVEPGMVVGDLNRRLRPMGLQFGPDVATLDRATLGGMIGNNSAGAHSIYYGRTVDHVQALDGLLSDGQRASFAPVSAAEIAKLAERSDRLGQIYAAMPPLLARHADEIRRVYPKVMRRVSGYPLDLLLDTHQAGGLDLTRLLVGSEGTLALVTEATLKLVPVPKTRGVAAVPFARLKDAMAAVAPLLQSRPAAIELLDQTILDLARAHPEYRGQVDFVRGQPAALLVVEYYADTAAEIDDLLAELTRTVGQFRHGPIVASRDPKLAEHVWSVRKIALPLIAAVPGRRKPITFVEDTAVAAERLPEFVGRFREILANHGTEGAFYGHASVGCLHIRPMLDLRSARDRVRLLAIADDVAALVREFDGAYSGEHGDGLARSFQNPKLFGYRLYEAFLAVKRVFDPDNILNPGKIVEAPLPTESLRDPIDTVTGAARGQAGPATVFSFANDGGLLPVAERCNGNGLCRRRQTGVMCPSFQATGDEQHTPRGRANLLAAALTGRLHDRPADGLAASTNSRSWADPTLAEALDLCLMCKACKSECPSSVDVAKMKMEYLQASYRQRRPPLLARLMAHLPAANRWGSRLAPLSNWVMRSGLARWLLEQTVGVDSRRLLPAYERRSLLRWFERPRAAAPARHGTVVLLADCFTSHHEPQVGRSAVALLEAAGYHVRLGTFCCGRTLLSKGFLLDAKKLVEQNLRRLRTVIEEGTPVLGMEPSCLFSLTDEWPDLVPGDQATALAKQVSLVESFLARQKQVGRCDLPPADEPSTAVLHGHCHQRAAGALPEAVAALAELAAISAQVLDTGCCGMAGSFGYEKDHYDVSVTIFRHRLGPALDAAEPGPILAPGFSCRCQIADLSPHRAQHPLELLADRLLPKATPTG